MEETTRARIATTETYSFDKRDPVARFLRDVMKLDWFKLWVVAILIYGPIEKLLIPYVGGYLHLSGGIAEWAPHVEALLTGFVEFPFFLGYYLWSGQGIANLFLRLDHNRIFADKGRYQSFMQQVEKALNHRGWPVLSVALALIAMALMNFVVWGPSTVVPPWFGDRAGHRMLSLAFIGLVAYAAAQSLIREILAVAWLRRLWSQMSDNVVVHPYHADGAGGLGAIGLHAVVLFCFVVMLLLFVFMGSVLPSLSGTGPAAPTSGLSIQFWHPIILAIWIAYIILVPIMFFLLIWPPHQAMRKVRDDRLNNISKLLERYIDDAMGYVMVLPQDMDALLADVVKKFKTLKDLHTVILKDSPIWPISARVQRLFGLTPVLPTVYSLLSVVVDLLR